MEGASDCRREEGMILRLALYAAMAYAVWWYMNTQIPQWVSVFRETFGWMFY